jgi:hypothetical protein
MLITPRPGVSRESLLDDLRISGYETQSLYGGTSAYVRLLDYLDWVGRTVEKFGNQISAADLERLVLTPRYTQLLAGVGTMTGEEIEVQRVVNGLVLLEVRQRADVFKKAHDELKAEIERWKLRGWTFVADSSFYIEHPEKLEDADFAALVPDWDDTVHLVVPMVVVDELDSLKQHKDRRIRWRAGYTLAVLDRLFQNSTEQATLRKADQAKQAATGIRQGEVTVQLLFDPVGHVRLPINDDEIVDRALAVKAHAGRQVTLLTYDTGQSSRGRFAELNVMKLSKSLEDEPKEAEA